MNQEVPFSRLGSLCHSLCVPRPGPETDFTCVGKDASSGPVELQVGHYQETRNPNPILSIMALFALLICLPLGLETIGRMNPLHDDQWPALTIPLNAVFIKSNIYALVLFHCFTLSTVY